METITENIFNQQQVLKIIEDFTDLGLFRYLTSTEIDVSTKKALASEIKSYTNVLLCFPKIIVCIDWETSNLRNPYEELTKHFESASQGFLKPKNIVDTFERSMLENRNETFFAFNIGTNKYKTSLKMQEDWLDSDFLTLIDEALYEEGVKARVYACINNGQLGGYIILSHSQHFYLLKNYPNFSLNYL